jgi:cellulose synthase/poly-beta-1,6-N-acetylglucosamine synthase-like glycosyltransferase
LATALEILLGAAALLLLLPVAVLFVEVLLAVSKRAPDTGKAGARGSLAIVVPAHDEASMVATTLRSILPELSASDRLIVVADNCSDETAAVAAASGAETIVRTDPARRGKGYALDFAVRHLARTAPDIVIVIDADCRVAPGSIDCLARVCTNAARPVQALYLMHSPPNAGPMTRIAEFAWALKNQVRPLGSLRLGLPCQLMGTGMAFPWVCISAANLASGHIVEDLNLGLELTRAGTPPLFCPEALVTSTFPASKEGIQNQRTRWEHGHLGVIASELPRLYMDAFAKRDVGLLAAALDLSVPPLALLLLQVTAVWCASLLLYFFANSAVPLIMASVVVILFLVSVLMAWAFYGRRIISFGSLALAAAYALLKIPLYARFLVARQVNWVRSKRD